MVKKVKDLHASEEDLCANHKLFIAEYLRNGMHATKAYQKVYGLEISDHVAQVASSRLLLNVVIKSTVEKRLRDIADAAEVDAVWALKRRMQMVDRCMQAEPVMEFDHESKKMEATGQYKFDSSGANAALTAIEKHHLGMAESKNLTMESKDGKPLSSTTVNVMLTEEMIEKTIAKKQDEY